MYSDYSLHGNQINKEKGNQVSCGIHKIIKADHMKCIYYKCIILALFICINGSAFLTDLRCILSVKVVASPF